MIFNTPGRIVHHVRQAVLRVPTKGGGRPAPWLEVSGVNDISLRQRGREMLLTMEALKWLRTAL